VRTEVEGVPKPLPAPVDAAAFRIVQESLTNVVRHARATAATVRIRYGEDDLTIQIDDDGAGVAGSSPSADGGRGIAGMRERVTALGGQLDAGRLPGRGFRIRARLPVQGASS
jgi:signal transduction histidine kinase